MDLITIRPRSEYQNLFDNDEITQFLQISHKKFLGEHILDANLNDNNVWIPYDENISLKTSLGITFEQLIRVSFGIPQGDQINILKILRPNNVNVEFEQGFIFKTLEEIKDTYENLVIEFMIL
jgi:hypothetical protein